MMRYIFILFALVITGCSPTETVYLINQTGQTITVITSTNNSALKTDTIANGDKGSFSFLNADVLIITTLSGQEWRYSDYSRLEPISNPYSDSGKVFGFGAPYDRLTVVVDSEGKISPHGVKTNEAEIYYIRPDSLRQ